MHTLAVVDDDLYWCHAIERFFRNEFEVYTFSTASTFLNQVFDYDLVMVDYSLPPLNYEVYIEGCELIHHLKTKLRYPPLVVLVSGYVSKNDAELGRQICPEADAFFPKDGGLEELLQQTKQLISSRTKKSASLQFSQKISE